MCRDQKARIPKKSHQDVAVCKSMTLFYLLIFFSFSHFHVFCFIIVSTMNNQSYEKKIQSMVSKIHLLARENMDTCIIQHTSCLFHGTAKSTFFVGFGILCRLVHLTNDI